MAFFDQIGKKISQTGQTAIQKTRDMADVAKLNANITDEEKKISNAYYQIGQLYVSKYKDNTEPDFEILIEQINQSENKIEEIKKQIQDIKGVKRCTTCGAEIPNNATFCSACGTAVVQEKAVNLSDLVKCDNCGKMIEKGMKFCTFCGSPIVEKEKIKCSNCGIELSDDLAFCTNCGTKVNKDNDEIITNSENAIIEPEDTNKTMCNNCGNIVDDDCLFCTKCGAKIERNMSDDDIAVEHIDEGVSETEVLENVCSNCGAVLDEDSAFCMQCGTKVN